MRIIYWTLTWFGLEYLSEWMCLAYTGNKECGSYPDIVIGASALAFIIIWLIGCRYFSENE